MAGKNTAAFGIYKSRAQAESAVDALQQAGFIVVMQRFYGDASQSRKIADPEHAKPRRCEAVSLHPDVAGESSPLQSRRANRCSTALRRRWLRLPELISVTVGQVPFPIVWSIAGSALFVAVLGFLLRRSD